MVSETYDGPHGEGDEMIEMRWTLLDRDFWLAAAGTVAGVLIAMCFQQWLGFVPNWWDVPFCAFLGVYCGYTARSR